MNRIKAVNREENIALDAGLKRDIDDGIGHARLCTSLAWKIRRRYTIQQLGPVKKCT